MANGAYAWGLESMQSTRAPTVVFNMFNMSPDVIRRGHRAKTCKDVGLLLVRLFFLGDFVCFTISRHFPLGSGNPQSLGGWGRSGCHGKAAGIWRPPLCSRLELYLFEQVIAGLNHSQIWRFEYIWISMADNNWGSSMSQLTKKKRCDRCREILERLAPRQDLSHFQITTIPPPTWDDDCIRKCLNVSGWLVPSCQIHGDPWISGRNVSETKA